MSDTIKPTMKKKFAREKQIITAVLILAALGLSGAGFLYYRILNADIQNTAYLGGAVANAENENTSLIQTLTYEKQKNSAFSAQISQILNTVNTLNKLSQTDKELLQKYSKVYFLSENYVPESLTDIPPEYLYQKDKETKIHTEVLPYLKNMISDAKYIGAIDLLVISAYRSFGEQSSLKGSYLVTYGSGANKFSADQGYSEHQLGTALDFTTAQLGADFSNFENSSAYKWLQDNAYRYGFVLSYPKGNAYYQFEPWHWRFVGKSLAITLHNENKYFYDLDQRTIDAYLINIFD